MNYLKVVLAASLAFFVVSYAANRSEAQVQTFTCPAAGGFGVLPPAAVPIPPTALLFPLNTVPNPVLPIDPKTGKPTLRLDLKDYIANLDAAIQLGKALFWEMQAGSDNKTACATCHFQAGADVRTRNQLNPGANGTFDLAGQNAQLTSASFPISPAYDDIAGSQGVRQSDFLSISGTGEELTTTPTGFRRVTGKNTPSAINAVFNHRQFWNGRAQPDFNGVNPFGSRDTNARVWALNFFGNPAPIDIRVQNASLASQAVGPPLNDVEMSAAGRTFPNLGKKLLLAKPLGLQKVDPKDSVLGKFADTKTGKGLTVSYKTLIQTAFQPNWWNSTTTVTVNGQFYSMMEANFSLFWGLAIMLYEATLVSDQTPMDQYLASRVFQTDPVTGLLVVDAVTGLPILVKDDPKLLNPVVNRLAAEGITVTVTDVLNGLTLFEMPLAPLAIQPTPFPPPPGFGLGCSACHFPGELTSATVRNLAGQGAEPGDAVLKKHGFDLRMERMFMKEPAVPIGTNIVTLDLSMYTVTAGVAYLNPDGTPTTDPPTYMVEPSPVPVNTYDAGWYNIGVRPTADDPGLDGTDPFGNFLSWTRLFQALPVPTSILVPGNGLACFGAGNAAFPNLLLNAQGFPLLSGPLQKDEATDVAGTFKTPALRNVEVNGPYFHNGSKSTLRQVVEFYNHAGDFANPTLAPAILPLLLGEDQKKSLVAFLVSLTDERVRWQKAPFDHPELRVPNGHNADASDNTITLPAVGAGGSPVPLQRFLNLNPFQP